MKKTLTEYQITLQNSHSSKCDFKVYFWVTEPIKYVNPLKIIQVFTPKTVNNKPLITKVTQNNTGMYMIKNNLQHMQKAQQIHAS